MLTAVGPIGIHRRGEAHFAFDERPEAFAAVEMRLVIVPQVLSVSMQERVYLLHEPLHQFVKIEIGYLPADG